jgi:hypothetical protein
MEGSKHGIVEALSWSLPGGAEECYGNLSKANRRPARDSNHVPHEYVSRALTETNTFGATIIIRNNSI